MKFSNKRDAIAFIRSSSVPLEEQEVLVRLIEEHALDREIKIIGSSDDITSLLFEADHNLEVEFDIGFAIISTHSLAGVHLAVKQSKENITMSNNAQTQDQTANLDAMEALIADSMKKVLAASMDGILEAALKKQQVAIDEVIKKTVDETVKKAVDEAMKAKSAEAPKADEKPAAQPVKGKEEGSTIKGTAAKAAAYLAGATAVAAGGWYAWSKWGGSSDTAPV